MKPINSKISKQKMSQSTETLHMLKPQIKKKAEPKSLWKYYTDYTLLVPCHAL